MYIYIYTDLILHTAMYVCDWMQLLPVALIPLQDLRALLALNQGLPPRSEML